MTDATASAAPAFSPKVILALLLVGLFAFSAFVVLSVYAPNLRKSADGGAHALSPAAVGFAGAVTLLRELGTPVSVNRTSPHGQADAESLLVVTPEFTTSAEALALESGDRPILIVLPKWLTVARAERPGWVRKIGIAMVGEGSTRLLQRYSKTSPLHHRKDVSAVRLTGSGPVFEGMSLSFQGVDRLQTLDGEGWTPALVDEQGRTVLASSKTKPSVFVLADPDLLNTQGLAKVGDARSAVAMLDALRGEHGVVFDVSLNGFERPRGLLQLMFEPPMLPATLAAVAAVLMMGLHALARFGPPPPAARELALGKHALVDNSAGLVRMARKEHQLAPEYAALVDGLVAKSAGGARALHGGDLARRLDKLARGRTALDRGQLGAEAAAAKNRADLLAVARKQHQWRQEMTRERR